MRLECDGFGITAPSPRSVPAPLRHHVDAPGAARRANEEPRASDGRKWGYGRERRDHGEETLAEIGRSYNVSGWTIARL